MSSSRVANRVEDIIKHWDRGSKAQRTAILTNFIRRHRTSTAAEIEKDLGHGAMLFFTRITAWLRLTYQLGQELSVQLSALSLFIQGQRFMMNFMEVGGVQTLTDILVHVKGENRSQDKNSALLILIHVANSGRVYREMVCDGDGIDMIVKATLEETNERTLELTASLFMSLGQGNPRKSSLVHSGLLYIMLHGGEAGALCAATTLRSLQLAKQAYSASTGSLGPSLTMVGAESGSTEQTDSLLNAFFHLLSLDSVKLRFEGTELLSIAAQNGMLIGPIVSRCLEKLESHGVKLGDDRSRQAAILREQAACGRILCNIILNPTLTEDSFDRLQRVLSRRSAHISLVRFLQLVDGRDVSAQVDCCKALKRLSVAESASTVRANNRGSIAPAAGGQPAEDLHFHLAEWIRDRVGEVLFDEFVRADQLSDEVAIAFSRALLAQMEKDAKAAAEAPEEEDLDEDDRSSSKSKRSGDAVGSSSHPAAPEGARYTTSPNSGGETTKHPHGTSSSGQVAAPPATTVSSTPGDALNNDF
jgi:hypothetical protein